MVSRKHPDFSFRRQAAWFAVITALFLAAGLYRIEQTAPEARVLEGICRELLSNTTPGRQGLFSSLWWGPLSVLLRLPLVALFESNTLPIGSLLVSASFAAATLLLVMRVLREWGVGAGERRLMILGIGVYPGFVTAACDGSSTTTVFYFMVLIVYGLVAWLQRRSVRHLVYLAMGAALLTWVQAETLPWVLTCMLLLGIVLMNRHAAPRQREASLILLCLPFCYVLALWVLMNWLIMGDAWFFCRSLFRDTCRDAAAGFDRLPFDGITLALLALCALTGLAAGARRNVAGGVLGAVGCALPVSAFWLRRYGWIPDAMQLLSGFAVIALISTGYLAVILPRLRIGIVLVPLLIAAAAWFGGGTGGMPASTTDPETGEANRLSRIERHVLTRSRYSKVFVCGYDSFALLGQRQSPVFEHALDFSFGRVRADYSGHRLFLLVRQPAGRGAMDSVHWQYDRLYTFGSGTTLYDGDWGPWRLFQIIEAPHDTP